MQVLINSKLAKLCYLENFNKLTLVDTILEKQAVVLTFVSAFFFPAAFAFNGMTSGLIFYGLCFTLAVELILSTISAKLMSISHVKASFIAKSVTIGFLFVAQIVLAAQMT